MKLRLAVVLFMIFISAVGVYNVCHESGGAIDTMVAIARRITYGALFAIGFTAASLVLRKYMSQPTLRPVVPTGVVPAPPVPTFGVAPAVPTGPGQYRVRGVDHDTRFETSEIVFADSPDNAKFKVELKGVEVVEIEPVF